MCKPGLISISVKARMRKRNQAAAFQLSMLFVNPPTVKTGSVRKHDVGQKRWCLE